MQNVCVYWSTEKEALIQRVLGVSPDAFLKTDQGKPYLSDGPEFNLSDSGVITVLAVGDVSVGVDIEQVRKRNFSRLQTLLHLEEQAYCAALTQGEKQLFFYRAWTLKEAYCKLQGIGISRARCRAINLLAPPVPCVQAMLGESVLTVCTNARVPIKLPAEAAILSMEEWK